MAEVNKNAAPATNTAAAAAPAAGTAAAAAAATKPAKPKAEPKPPRFDPKATVHFLPVKGEDGKKYGPANTETTKNPKRESSKSFTWFANYEEGITIERLAEKYKTSGGSMNANLDWDVKHGFIEIRPPKAA